MKIIASGPSLHGKYMGKQWNSNRLYFIGLQNRCRCDCSHEIKRCLLHGRKAMTNLVKIHLVTAMVFPVVMYGCESWIVKKNWCFWTVVLEKIFESPLDIKETQSVHPKGDQSWVFIGRIDAEAVKLWYFGDLMQRDNSFEKTLMLGKIESKRRRK